MSEKSVLENPQDEPNQRTSKMGPSKTGPSKTTRIVVVLLAVVLFSGFFGLGYWQVERRAWKLDLIERVDARVHGDAVTASDQADWENVSRARDEYRKVTLLGTYRNDLETQVYAATDYGAGYWVITPMERVDGTIIMINRGFVPTSRRDPESRPETLIDGQARVTGLLRMDEPVGTFIRDNVPEEDRWYSRDVKAMAIKQGISPDRVAPYFIDADGKNNPDTFPVGGLTKISFPNNHLMYALTWFGMALLTLVAAWIVLRTRRSSNDQDGFDTD